MKNYIFLILAMSQTSYAAPSWQWNCKQVQETALYQQKVLWKTLQCDGSIDHVTILKGLNINVITAPSNDPEIKFRPQEAQTSNQLAKLPDIAENLNATEKVLAGINGGYFYRNDVEKFVDNICYDKTNYPPNANESMGDSLLQHDGKNYAVNCAFIPGKITNARAALILSGHNNQGSNAPYITLVDPDTIYKYVDGSIPDAIGAGPNLITHGKLTVNNPDEALIPTNEFAANSAVGIMNATKTEPQKIILFTVDGNNDSFKNNWPAMNASEMADFMLHYLHVDDAISMDQGGSATMYVAASDANDFPKHVVSNSHYDPNIPRSEKYIRPIYDGLFITIGK